jgi:putative ABC transport system substrate-binding protein
VFVGVADPVGQGFIASLARPGDNITGFSVFDAPMAGKWLEMLTQIAPPVERVAMLFNPATTPYASLMLHAIEEAASSFAVAVQGAPVNSDAEVETMMAELARQKRGGVLVLPSVFIVIHREAIIASAARNSTTTGSSIDKRRNACRSVRRLSCITCASRRSSLAPAMEKRSRKRSSCFGLIA